MMTSEKREEKRKYINDNIAESREVIEYLEISRARLNQYVKSGRLEPIRKGIYLKDDIEAFRAVFDEARANNKWLKEFE